MRKAENKKRGLLDKSDEFKMALIEEESANSEDSKEEEKNEEKKEEKKLKK